MRKIDQVFACGTLILPAGKCDSHVTPCNCMIITVSALLIASNYCRQLNKIRFRNHVVTTRIRRLGKVLFSQMCVCQRGYPMVSGPRSFTGLMFFLAGGSTQSCHWFNPRSCLGGGGTPVLSLVLPRSMRGYPNLGQGGTTTSDITCPIPSWNLYPSSWEVWIFSIWDKKVILHEPKEA